MTSALTGASGPAIPAVPPPAGRAAVAEPDPDPGGHRVWRKWRAPLAVVAAIIAGGVIVALLQPSAGTTGYLDPGNPQPDGARALATLLTQRGTAVTRVSSVAGAAAAAPAGSGTVTLLITDPELLTVGQLRSLARLPGNRIIAEPDPAVLAVLAPGVTEVRQTPVRELSPQCTLTAAQRAGSADLGGSALHSTAAGATACYPDGGHPSLIRYAADGRVITVLGTGAPLANANLARLGNAALTLNLLRGRARLVWLVPGPPAPGSGGAGGQQAFTSIVPAGAYLVLGQLVIAAVLAAWWRGRRLGPVVAERLPVVVRSAETVEGHGRLYRAHRSRDRAATALRDAARGRILRVLGLPATAEATTVAALLAARSGRPAEEITALLAGPVPADDATLVALADGLDALEREVRIP